jgi:hypothetical protein
MIFTTSARHRQASQQRDSSPISSKLLHSNLNSTAHYAIIPQRPTDQPFVTQNTPLMTRPSCGLPKFARQSTAICRVSRNPQRSERNERKRSPVRLARNDRPFVDSDGSVVSKPGRSTSCSQTSSIDPCLLEEILNLISRVEHARFYGAFGSPHDMRDLSYRFLVIIHKINDFPVRR